MVRVTSLLAALALTGVGRQGAFCFGLGASGCGCRGRSESFPMRGPTSGSPAGRALPRAMPPFHAMEAVLVVLRPRRCRGAPGREGRPPRAGGAEAKGEQRRADGRSTGVRRHRAGRALAPSPAPATPAKASQSKLASIAWRGSVSEAPERPARRGGRLVTRTEERAEPLRTRQTHCVSLWPPADGKAAVDGPAFAFSGEPVAPRPGLHQKKGALGLGAGARRRCMARARN